MSTFDRIERRMPELMSELAPAAVPDYFDDMLRQAGRTRQRPAWASLERWLPMDVVARPVLVRAPALRPLVVLLLIGLLLVAGLALYAGTQRSRLPEPFGPARNGLIAFATVDGDVAAYDPENGSTTTLIAGTGRDAAPMYSRDGQMLAFIREDALWVADADGSNPREVLAAPISGFDWSDTNDRLVIGPSVDPYIPPSVIDLRDGTTTVFDARLDIQSLAWRPGHDELIATATAPDGEHALFYLINPDGTDVRPIGGVVQDAAGDAAASPDGTRITYSSWSGGSKYMESRLHVLDIDSGQDRLMLFDGSDQSAEMHPRFSPDGTKLLFKRYGFDDSYLVSRDERGYQLVVAPAEGDGPAVRIGSIHASSGERIDFSPDGSQVLVMYYPDYSTWALDSDGPGQRRLPWSGEFGYSWQRLAP
jgi:WD40-like Beta Propeller Repeat